MSCIFAVRSDSFNARVSRAGKIGKPAGYGQLSGQSAFLPALVSDAAAIGGTTFDMADNAEVAKVILWPGFDNLPSATTRNISVVIRVRFQTYAINQRIWMLGSAYNLNSISLSGTLGTSLRVEATDGAGTTCINSFNAAHGLSSTALYNDIVVTWDGTTTANSLKVYVNGSSITSQTPAAVWSIAPFCQSQIVLGGYQSALNASRMFVNEFLIFDEVLSAGTISTEFAGTGRTSFYSVAAYDGLTWPTEASTLNTQTWNEFGVGKTGTATIPSASNVKTGSGLYGVAGSGSTPSLTVPTLANTKIGVAGDGGTGTYDGSDRWTDPGETNVKNAIAYKANSTSNNKTGNLVSTDPGITNVISGIDYTIESVVKEGTYSPPTSTNPGVENVLLDVEYTINDVDFEGTFDPNSDATTMRQFLNFILDFIGAESLTNDEYSSITLEDDSFTYNQEKYDALLTVLESREDVSDAKDRLKYEFMAKGVDVEEAEDDITGIYLGDEISGDDGDSDETKSNIYAGGVLED